MDNQLVPIQEVSLPSANEWKMAKQMADEIFKSGFLPSHIKTSQQALAIIMRTRELNIPPMQGLYNLYVINQRVAAQSELMLGLALRTGRISYTILSDTATNCEIEFVRSMVDGQTIKYTASYTIEDAKKAGLLVKDVWQKYPSAMLRARTIAKGLRVICPDVIGGLSTPEELGANVIINKEGKEEVIVEEDLVNDRITEPQRLKLPPRVEDAEIVGQEQPILTPGDNGGQPKPKADPQLIKIHELLGKLKPFGYEDDLYRQDLDTHFKGVKSSKDLNATDKEKLIALLAGKMNDVSNLTKDMDNTNPHIAEIQALVKKMGIATVAKEYMQTFYGVGLSKDLNENHVKDFLSFLLDCQAGEMTKEQIIAQMQKAINRENEAKTD